MQEQQQGSSEPSKSQNKDKPKHQENIKNGWEVPRDYVHALQLDIQNGNNKWKDAIDLEIEQIKESKYSKIMEKLFMRRQDCECPQGISKDQSTFCLQCQAL